MKLYNKYRLWHGRLARLGRIWSSEGLSVAISETLYKLQKRYRRYDGRLMKVFFEVTSRCNSRCISCKIYERPPTNELSLSEIEKMFRSECMKNLGHIDLTGGEPFLRDDLADIANMAYSLTGCVVGMSTNGLLPKKIYETVKRMHPKPEIHISLNGPKETHDFTRGIKGNYEKVMETYGLLWSLGLKPIFQFCINPYNFDDINWAYELADKLGTGVGICMARPEPRLQAYDLNIYEYSEEQKGKILEQLRPGMVKDVIERILSNSLRFTCQAGQRILHVSSNGDIFPCHDTTPEWKNMGNVRQNSLDEIMSAPRTKGIIERISNFECQPCNMATCFATTSLWCGGRLLSEKDVREKLQLQ